MELTLRCLFFFFVFFINFDFGSDRNLSAAGVNDSEICSNSKLNDCVEICRRGVAMHKCDTCSSDAPGSYICSCPPQYLGDARRLGTGCTFSDDIKSRDDVDPKGTKRGTFLLVLVGTFFTIIFGLCILCSVHKAKRLRSSTEEPLELEMSESVNELPFDDSELPTAEIFTYNQLRLATGDFKDANILGRGGQGTVYKGVLVDGREVAIKKTINMEKPNIKEFINEIKIPSEVKHDNIVRLIGYCAQAEHILIVYKLLPGGTLHKLVHDNTSFLPWKRCLQISIDIAKALHYLHSLVPKSIYHRDIKSRNILIDDMQRAVVGDFGISVFLEGDKTHLTTKFARGTDGYICPEFIRTRQYTDRSDVFSFAVLLVELLTRKNAVFPEESQKITNLYDYFTTSVVEGNLFKILHPQVVNSSNKHELEAVAALVNKCLNHMGKDRPTMGEICLELERLFI